MAVTEKGHYTVKPASPTWTGRLPLSELDQTLAYVPTLYFYRPPHEWLEPRNRIVSALRDSLGLVLVHFYTLAARVSWAPHHCRRLELHCNAAGARLVEAESDATLDDYGDFSLAPQLANLVPGVDYKAPVHEIPLLIVQVTRFRCGGISLGMTMSHAACDGLGAFRFIGEWARLARGETIDDVPFLDRNVLLSRTGDPNRFNHAQFDLAPLLLGEPDTESERSEKTAMIKLELTQAGLEALKEAANEDPIGGDSIDAVVRGGCRRGRPCSRYDAMTAHVWRCMCKARGHHAEQETRVGVCVDFRRRVRPPMPGDYFGNAALNVAAAGLAGDLVAKPLSYAARKVKEAVESVTDEYVRSALTFLKNQPDLSRFQDLDEDGDEDERGRKWPFYGNPNLRVTSWTTLPVYGKDFGWGEEVHMGLGMNNVDGDAIILPSRLGDGSVVVVCCLQARHADAFKKFFYEDITYKKLVRHQGDFI